MWDTFVGFLPFVAEFTPANVLDIVTNVVGGAAIVASAFVPTNNRILERVRFAVNMLRFNFGKAKNRD